jgi:hypothetical protein
LPEGKEKEMTKAIAIILALVLLPVSSFALSSISCGDRTVAVGDTKDKVLARCGPPALTKKEYPQRAQLESGPGGSSRVVREVETWIYNPGQNRALRVLTFEGNTLTRITLGGFGYSP